MRRNRTLFFVMLGLICVLTAGSLLLHFDYFPQAGTGGEDSETIVLFLPAAEVTAVSWTGGEAPDFALQRHPENGWYCPASPGTALDQARVEGTVAALCQVVSNRAIESPQDAAAYGLGPAGRRVELTLSGGQAVAYYLGSLNPYTNRYYFQMEGDSTIHAVGYSVGQAMNDGVSDYAAPPPQAQADTPPAADVP